MNMLLVMNMLHRMDENRFTKDMFITKACLSSSILVQDSMT
jgi:hypothetical protein